MHRVLSYAHLPYLSCCARGREREESSLVGRGRREITVGDRLMVMFSNNSHEYTCSRSIVNQDLLNLCSNKVVKFTQLLSVLFLASNIHS